MSNWVSFDASSNQDLAIWGTNLTSTIRVIFILKQLAMVQFSPYQRGVIIGLLLSDDWLTIPTKRNKNVRVRFKQSADHASYVLFVFKILSQYCSNSPKLTTGIRSGKRFWGLEFFPPPDYINALYYWVLLPFLPE